MKNYESNNHLRLNLSNFWFSDSEYGSHLGYCEDENTTNDLKNIELH